MEYAVIQGREEKERLFGNMERMRWEEARQSEDVGLGLGLRFAGSGI